MNEVVNVDVNWREDDNFYIKSFAKKGSKRLIALDIDGTLTTAPSLFKKCKEKGNICGLVSHRKMSYIFDFAERIRAKPDFVCSASFSVQGTKERCLRLSAKKFKTNKKVYVGDRDTDKIDALKANFWYIDIETGELFKK